MTDPTLTNEELAKIEGFLDRDPHSNVVALFKTDVRHLIAALRASRAEVEALKKNQITHEYDEETGYCLCTCCDHGI